MDYNIINNGEGFMITGTGADGITWHIPTDESNSMYQQYLIDTDGGLPLPEEQA